MHKDKGFTLVELLVVIIIIGILAAIAIPAFLNQRQKGFDATLKADLKNAQTTIETYYAGGGTNASFRALTGSIGVVELRGDNVPAFEDPQWKDFPSLGYSPVGDDSRLHFITFGAPSGRWIAHAEGDYCIAGRNAKSQYDYPGGDARRYDEFLFIDAQSGGLRTIDQLVERRASGKQASCKGYVDNYMVAKGMSIPAVTG